MDAGANARKKANAAVVWFKLVASAYLLHEASWAYKSLRGVIARVDFGVYLLHEASWVSTSTHDSIMVPPNADSMSLW